MIKSSWSDIDRTAIDFVKSWANETEPRTSRTKVAAALGFTYQAIKKKFNYENAPLTLGEFEKMCNYFNKNSAAEWMKILQAVAIKNGKINEAKLIDDMLNDHTVKNAIVNLAITYLHPSSALDEIPDPATAAELKQAQRTIKKNKKKGI
ncbi:MULTISPECIES: hypothetical protein [Bifidobacterium]|uniref:Uncharacterized protein n=2 Tax=Bifidobacterium TaxID=1678 RepID=A0A261G094_9BIFI|nr:hypothetical protein [Bifidobacterium aquikefiri]OZG64864.1 hypothetical protein BAQU_2006 [Bifidobacterium aquikefiri]